MNFIARILSFFRLSAYEKEIFRNEIEIRNMRRTLYVCLVAVSISIVHIVLFSLKAKEADGIELQWAEAILHSHIAILIVASVCGILTYFFSYRIKKNPSLAKVCTAVILTFLLFIGALIASIDQRVTSAITPYINTALIVSLVFTIRPFYASIYYIATYIFFYFLLAQTQTNPEILFSNRINGLTTTVLGLSLSYILWSVNLNRIKQSQQIEKQNEALFESNAEKDKFFSIMTHDLKSPLNSILGFSNLLIKQVEKQNYTKVKEYAKIIRRTTIREMDLLMNLGEWSQSQTGRMEFNPEYFDIIESIKDIEQLFLGILQQKKISVAINVPTNAVVFADKQMISTILRNLISNAIKFTHSEGEIAISLVKNQSELTVSVVDNGVGISQESIDKLFKVSETISTLGTDNEKGTGLGLLLCKEFVERHSGRIWVESEPGSGSTFYFALPNISESGENSAKG